MSMSRSRLGLDTSGTGLSGDLEANDSDLEAELEPLPEDTLTRNLGLDLIVVVTKVSISHLIIHTEKFHFKFSALEKCTQ